MADRMTPEQRHKCMSRIRSKNTKPELLVRRYLFGRGFRYRVNVKRLPGTPDIVLRKYRTVIFINGCFWHGHEDCKLNTTPKTNTEYWKHKVDMNRERDMEKRIQLRLLGWHTIIIWECQLKPKVRETTLKGLELTLNTILLENYGKPKEKTYDTPACEESPRLAAEEIVNYGHLQHQSNKLTE